ncbi:MAG: DUF2012 domain-containing protein, partial [Candidatus Marinimicrobia bacterium]|nr:DUF2012 domain-containing protein [Candidatus Neomarinimicrobiota bacterium]
MDGIKFEKERLMDTRHRHTVSENSCGIWFGQHFMRMIRVVLLVALLSSGHQLNARSIAGRIIDAISSQPLPHTNVLLLEAGEGTIADNSGYFNFNDVPAGTYTLQVAHIGYAQVRKTVDISPSDEQAEFIQLQLHQEALTGENIVVSATAADFHAEAGVSRSSLNYRDLNTAPAFVEADLFRTIKTLPGVVSQNDFSAAFVVRGGAPDENLILLDGMEIYNPYHFGGIFSVFNTQAIENVDFQSGGFSAEYGGRLSSVVSAHTKTGSEHAGLLQNAIPSWRLWDVNSASVSLSLLSASARVEGPLHKGSYSITGRRTYFDKLSGAVNKKSASVPEIPYYFYDVQWSANTALSRRHRLYFSGYSGMDDLALSLGGAETLTYQTDFAWNWGNQAQSVRLHSLISPNVLVKTTLGQSVYNLQADLSTLDMNYTEMHAENNFTISNRLESIKFAQQYYWSPPGNHSFSGGVTIQKYDLSLGLAGNGVRILDNSTNPLLVSLYAQDRYRINSRLKIEGGIRGYHYSDSDRPWLDLRSSLIYALSHRTDLKASLGSYTQFLFTTNQNNDVIRVVDFYSAVPDYQKPERARHFILGLDHALTTTSRVSLEAYYKPYSNILMTNPLQRVSEHNDDFISGTGQV